MGKAKKHVGNPVFIHSHALKYGLKVMELTELAQVVSVRCQFCIYFGPEIDPTKERARSAKTTKMAWKRPFETTYYLSHHKSQHPTVWDTYLACSAGEKAQFFANVKTPYANTMFAHINSGSSARPLTFKINQPIVDVLIGDLFFHPDDHGGTTQAAALKLFKVVDSGLDDDYYETYIPNAEQFRMVISNLSRGMSFRQCVGNHEDIKENMGVYRLGPLTEAKVTGYARIVLANSFQRIAKLLDPRVTRRSSWAFSLASDGSTHYTKSYLDNRIRIHRDGKLYNLHLVAIPMYGKHTGENMFNLISRILDIVCQRWRSQLIGVAADGAASMTGKFQGVVTRLNEVSTNTKFYRIWCGLHQLDLVLKHAYKDLWDNEVVEILKKFIAHLRQQVTLINDMRVVCPQLTTRWLCMGDVCEWMLAHRDPLFNYMATAAREGDPVTTAPPNWWWVVVAGISALTDIINPVFTKLQSPTLLVSTQRAILNTLAADVSTMLGISEIVDAALDLILEPSCIVYGDRCVDYKIVFTFLQDLGMHTRHTLAMLDEQVRGKVMESIGRLGVGIVEGILKVQAERDQDNRTDTDELPPVLPHELLKMSTGQFGKDVVDIHLEQLRRMWNAQDIAGIETDHRNLRMAYHNEPALRSAIDAYARTHVPSFEAAWDVVEGRFDILRDFCGGIATVFANTASVESDFSILGWEKDEYRKNLTDLSLEGILHCKQDKLLRELAI